MKKPNLDQMQYELAMAGGGLYSAVDQAAQNIKRKEGPGQAFINELMKQPNVKKDELEERGLTAMAQKPKMTREQMLRELKIHEAPQIQERVLKTYKPDEDEIHELAREIWERDHQEDKPLNMSWNDALEYARESLYEKNEHEGAQYENYTLPGGENYRELLLHLPQDRMRPQNNYKSSHFGVQNVLAHMRLKDREGPAGEKLLHLEELQSDWHQAGKNQGYGEIKKPIVEAYYEDSNGNIIPVGFGRTKEEADSATAPNWKKLVEIKYRNYDQVIGHGVPNGPFKNSWHEMALKHLINHAAQNGYQGIVITPGEEQNARYPNPERNPKGMTTFYDEKIPSVLNKLGKRYGAQVGTTLIPAFDQKAQKAWEKIYLNDYGEDAERAKARAELSEPSVYKSAHHFPITEEMRQDVLKQGQPMYELGGVVHKAEGGTMNPTPTMAEMRLALLRSNPLAVQSYGANEAPGMNPKAYIPPDIQQDKFPPPGGAALPTGGIDTDPTQAGQQLMPQQQQGVPPSPTGAAGQPAPQGLQGQGSPLQQPPSNILQMTPQGRALGAIKPPQAPQGMPGMAAGGKMSVEAMKQELALPVDQKAVREPSIGMLKGAFDQAIAHHESLPLRDRANNGKQARQTIEGYIGKGTKLLAGNIKLQKAAGDVEGYEPITLPDGRGVVTTGLSLSPAYEEGKFNTCPNSKSCAKQCLGKTANGNYIYGGGKDLEAMLGPRLAHFKKTQALLREPEAFATRLHDEITARKMKAAEENNMLAIRLNVLSDLHPKVYESLIKSHPDVMFYDYTKNNTRPVAPNHHLTYSSTGVSQPKHKTGLNQDIENPHQNWKLVRGHLDNGRNVAMPFSHRDALPDHIHDEESGKTYKVIDGDTHDFRPLDTQAEGNDGVIIGLRKKSMLHANHNAAINSDGFFTHYDPKFKKDKGKIVRDAEGNPVRTNTVVSVAKQKSGLITLNNDGKKE